MKALLASLMCLVLIMSQAFAISGGPFSGKGRVSVTGTYAGVLVPIVDPTIGLADNSLALFTMRIPETALATGTVAVFRNGLFYPGTITGAADPDSARLTAVVNATFDITFTQEIDPVTHTTRNTVVTYNANGAMTGKIVGTTQLTSASSARIRGQANLTYKQVGGVADPAANSGAPVPYMISGFKQSQSTN